MEDDVSLLSARPKWIVPKIFMWMTLIPFMSVIVFLGASQWAMWEAEKFHALQKDDDTDSVSPFDWGFDLWDVSVEIMWIIPSLGVLWLLSLVADKLDQLVWLKASDRDRFEILQKRRGAKKP
jgi:hypothetical protein